MEHKTMLYKCHLAAAGNMVPFAGFMLPLHYAAGIIAEHLAVRKAAGLFDVSHMGEVIIQGGDALENLNNLLCNDISGLQDGRVRYSPMLNERGGVIDDLIVYRLNAEKYMLVVNASNRAKDVAWMREHLRGEVKLEDISDETSELALQGPLAKAILGELVAENALPQRYYSFSEAVKVADIPCLISQTGYTGEHGYELYVENRSAAELWEKIMQAGKAYGLLPSGLGARDTLRLEAGMPLYGHEMSEDISPLEAGLDFAVKMTKNSFMGKEALAAGEPTRRRFGLKVTGRGIIRENAAVYLNGERIGYTTSGTHAPFLGYGIAMALLDAQQAGMGQTVEAEVRGRRIAAEIVALPFYQRS